MISPGRHVTLPLVLLVFGLSLALGVVLTRCMVPPPPAPSTPAVVVLPTVAPTLQTIVTGSPVPHARPTMTPLVLDALPTRTLLPTATATSTPEPTREPPTSTPPAVTRVPVEKG